jgi:AmmeMemoRadiSam system protein A
MDLILSEQEKKILLLSARETLEAKLEKRQPRYPEPTPPLESSFGLFVTLRTRTENLRGCIGNLTGHGIPLFELVRDMAESSAFQDPRFPPVKKEEIKTLKIEISILSAFEESPPEKVSPGTHGILIRRGYNSGLLLPQVAVEQGWNREQFLSHGCMKAGLPPETWQQKGTAISVFTALVFSE